MYNESTFDALEREKARKREGESRDQIIQDKLQELNDKIAKLEATRIEREYGQSSRGR